MKKVEKRREDFPIAKRIQNPRRWTKEMKRAYQQSMLEHAKDRAYEALIQKAAWVRGCDSGDFVKWKAFLDGCRSGEITLDPGFVDCELEQAAEKMKMHARCRARFLVTGHTGYCRFPGDDFVDKDHCDVCGHSLACDHDFEEISGAECDRLGIKHFGNCWHVTRCKLCGEISSYDSSG